MRKWLPMILMLVCGPAWAQQAADCSLTVTNSAAPVLFPKSGGTGNPQPSSYLEICDAHATNTIGINWVGGTAAIGSNGTLTLDPSKGIACKKWTTLADGFVPNAVSIIASASSTTTACAYR